jgi:cytochrome P450
VTLDQLERDPHPLLATLRAREPVSWLPVLGGWLVTPYQLALEVMRDPARFTVDDRRFSTRQVVGPSMLTLDGGEHVRNRAPFVEPFRLGAVRARFTTVVAAEIERLLDAIEPSGAVELRRSFAGPLAATIAARALGLDRTEVSSLLAWYEAIVDAVTKLTAGQAAPASGHAGFTQLRERIEAVLRLGPDSSLLAAAAADRRLTPGEIVSNAAVLLFGGIETTEGMIANAVLHLLASADQLALVREDPRLVAPAVEESLRLEPAAAVVDRYATREVNLAGAQISAGELVRVSISAANRDPAVFADPERFDVRREGAGRQLAFAHGPHVCLGIHLARLEARTALARLIARLPALRLDPRRPASPRGLVFRKPPELWVRWD